MKILYCKDTLKNPNGMERVLTTKANYLADVFGYKVYIVLTDSESVPFFPLSKKIELLYADETNFKNCLEKILFSVKPDITISMYGREAEFLYKINDGSKKILEFHFTKHYLTYLVKGIQRLRFRHLHLLKAWWLQKKEERLAQKYDKVVLLSEQDLHIWGEKPNMTFIHNPLSFHSEQTSTCDNKVILAAGRFIAQKGFDLLIDAYSMISEKFPEWKVRIYGEGQDEEILKQLISKYGVQEQIIILPPTDKIQEKMLESSIFAFPSRYEGFGLVLTEAMECGLPCISFDCECGPSEIIDSNETGFLIENGDTKTFAKCLAELMENKTLRKQMGKNARRRVARFYTDEIMKRWKTLFNNI